MTTCPRCDGPLEDTPIGPYCEACRWYFTDDPPIDADPGPALPMWIDSLEDGNDIRTPYGMCTAWNGGRPR